MLASLVANDSFFCLWMTGRF